MKNVSLFVSLNSTHICTYNSHHHRAMMSWERGKKLRKIKTIKKLQKQRKKKLHIFVKTNQKRLL